MKRSPASLASCGRANSAPSNDSGHVSAEPYSLPSVSSTKVLDIFYLEYSKTKANSVTSKTQEMSIASSPPLDLDPAEDLTAEDVILHSTEFTKVRNGNGFEHLKYSELANTFCEGDKEAASKTWSRGSRKKRQTPRLSPGTIHSKSEQIGGDLLLSTEKLAEKVRISGRQNFATNVRLS